MNEHILDISKIPKFQFQLHNEELTNCIKELHFMSKTHEKHLAKAKKDIQARPSEQNIADLLTVITSNIDIDPKLEKMVGEKPHKNAEGVMNIHGSKLGVKIGQISQLLRILFDKNQVIEKRLDSIATESKIIITEKCTTLQAQIDDFKKTQNKENRSINETIQLNLNKYEQKLREVQSKTLWQINDCNTKLSTRISQQFVRDMAKQTESRLISKVQESLVKNNIDPERIDKLESRCLRLEKEIEIKMVENIAKLNELKQSVQHNLASKKEVANERLENEKKFGNLQVLTAELARKTKNTDMELGTFKQDLTFQTNKLQDNQKQIAKMSKLVSNLKISDDFQKLMQNLDPHKICQIDNTLNNLAERDLKIEKELDAMKRYQEKLKQKVEICNMLNPTQQKGKLDRQEITKIFAELVTANPTFKKIQNIEGQLYEFKAHGDMINEINKRIGKIQKEFDLQSVIYNIKGLEQYIKKELLVMTTKMQMLESQLAEQRKRRPISARKTSDGRMTSSVSYKKLTPVDCISCFQNPMERTPPQQRRLFGHKY